MTKLCLTSIINIRMNLWVDWAVRASKLTFVCFQLQLLNTMQGLNNWSWKLRVSFHTICYLSGYTSCNTDSITTKLCWSMDRWSVLWWCKQQSRMQFWWRWLLQSEHFKLGQLLWYLWMPWVHNYTYNSYNNKQTNAVMSKSMDWWSVLWWH